VATLTVEALGAPFDIDGTKVLAQFTADATVGVKWSLFRDKVGGNFDYTPTLDDTATHDTFNGGLWLLDCAHKPSPGDDRVLVGPEDAADFTAYTIDGVSDTLMMEWTGVAVPGAADGDTFWVRMICQLEAAGDDNVKWYGWFGREKGASVSADFFTYPRMIVQQTVTVATTAEAASQRCRLLTPLSAPNGFDQFSNADMLHRFETTDSTYGATTSGFLATSNNTNPMLRTLPPWTRSRYPNPYWQLQFAALCACKADEAEYLRTLYIQARDANGWDKFLETRVIETSGSDRYQMMCVAHQCPHEKAFTPDTITSGTGDEVRYPAEWANSFGPRYQVETAAFTAASDDWWYDCADRYRTWYEAAESPPTFKTNPNGGPTRTDPLFLVATIQIDPNDDVDFANQIGTIASILDRQMRSTLVGETARVLHCQTYWKDADGVLFRGVQNIPFDGSVVENLTDRFSRAKGRGFNTSVYVNPAELRYRPSASGVRALRGGENANAELNAILGGSPAMTEGWEDEITYALSVAGAGSGIYMDVFLGARLINYNARGSETPTGVGNSSFPAKARKRAFIEFVRSRLGNDAVIASESAEEGVYGLDWMGQGYTFYPSHTLLADADIDTTVFSLSRLPHSSATDVPSARNLNPPLWNAVHHEWAPAGVLCGALNSVPLATNTRHHAGSGGGSTDAGMTDTQFRENQNFAVACPWSQGYFAHCFSVFHYDHELILDLDLTGSDSGNTGAPIWAFYKTLYEALREDYGGQFLRFGRMQRPLQVDYTSADVERDTNPANHWTYIQDWADGGRIPTSSVADAQKQAMHYSNYFAYMTTATLDLPDNRWGNNAFEVPRVMHSCWQNVSAGTIGIVFVNWSPTATAAFRGTFDPTLYGITGTYEVDRLDLADPTTATNIATGQSGTTVIGWGGGVGKDIDLGGGGELAAESVYVLRITEN